MVSTGFARIESGGRSGFWERLPMREKKSKALLFGATSGSSEKPHPGFMKWPGSHAGVLHSLIDVFKDNQTEDSLVLPRDHRQTSLVKRVMCFLVGT